MVRRDQVIGIPEEWRRGVDALTVGSIKVNPSTAYRLLRDFVGLRAGDWVIQNGANSGVGRAVIQLARPMGVHTINVVRDRAEEAEYAGLERELKGLGADIVVRDSDLGSDAFKAQVRALGKHAVRLGLNCVGGRMTLAMTKHLAEGAMLVSYGGMSRQPVVLPTSLLLFKDISARGFWMNRWYEQQQQQQQQQAAEEDEEGVVGERDRMWRDILQLAREGRFVAQPMHKVAWSDELLSLAEAQQLVRGAVDWSSGGKRAFVFG
ncbi:mitochondrial 2-enoyl thioester reductase [Coemansia sp. RSA 1694]|nr:mitochondrial 2-enoyl thioester reductase [Coemansia sp. RSA 1694]